MATFTNSFNLLDENELIGIVDAKAEDAFMAVVKKYKEEEKKKKGEEEKKLKKPQGQRKTEFWYSNPRPIRAKRLVLPRSFLKSQIVLCKNKDQDQGQGNGVQVKDSAQSGPITGQSQNGADPDPKAVRPVSSTASTGSERSNNYSGPPQRANGGQYYGRANHGYNYSRRYYQEVNGGYEGRGQSHVEGGKINNGGQNYGRANHGYNYPRRYYQEGNGGYEGRVQSHVEDGGQNYGRVNGGYNGNYDHQRAQCGFRDERGRRWRGNGYQGRGRYFEAENNHGNNNGLVLEKEEGAQVVVEKEQQEQGGVEEGNTQQQVQSNGVTASSNKSSSEGKKKPNINGSLRRKMKKQKKEAEAIKNQGDNNAAAAAPEGTGAAVSSFSVQKKFTDTFTLKEYEKEVAKKKDVEVVEKSSDGDCDRTETLVKEFELMRVIGKKKLEEEKKVSVPKPQDKSAEVNRKKDGANVKIKTQTININEFQRPQNKKDGATEGHDSQKDGRIEAHHHSKRDGRIEAHHHSQRDGRFERNHHSQRDGRFEGHHHSQRDGIFEGYHSQGDGRFKGRHSQTDGRFEGHRSRQHPVKKPASFEIDEGQFPDLGKSRILTVKNLK
ncbi:hypothetical protein L3X38_039386 [Prunus dulcis]|uniref:Uncharacterized protein n=1 Tax=Prunus dulcis TaxID=3755 RepID=A0AAD4V847_PRUDU|nr:hypothetical protein L3X38_039386 [Prunus dulcis]